MDTTSSHVIASRVDALFANTPSVTTSALAEALFVTSTGPARVPAIKTRLRNYQIAVMHIGRDCWIKSGGNLNFDCE